MYEDIGGRPAVDTVPFTYARNFVRVYAIYIQSSFGPIFTYDRNWQLPISMLASAEIGQEIRNKRFFLIYK
jgi:hypothetical protein